MSGVKDEIDGSLCRGVDIFQFTSGVSDLMQSTRPLLHNQLLPFDAGVQGAGSHTTKAKNKHMINRCCYWTFAETTDAVVFLEKMKDGTGFFSSPRLKCCSAAVRSELPLVSVILQHHY